MKEDITIFKFFNSISDFTKEFVTSLECSPIKVKGDLHVLGIRRHYKNGIPSIDFHLKHLKERSDGKISNIPCEDNGEIWIDSTLFQESTSRDVVSKIVSWYESLSEFDLAKMAYKPSHEPSNCANKEEVTIYENNHAACEGMRKKRLASTSFRAEIRHFEKNGKQEKKYTDEELAEL